MAEKWTKTSLPPSISIKPYPLLLLNHLTRPVATNLPPPQCEAELHRDSMSRGRKVSALPNTKKAPRGRASLGLIHKSNQKPHFLRRETLRGRRGKVKKFFRRRGP